MKTKQILINPFKIASLIGGIIMVLSLIILTSSLLISFPFADNFTIYQQAIAHVTTIVIAGVFKVGYVIFIVGRYERGLAF
ncbi:hypothetical protein [Photobacterium swingsii]|uniref:hypothetical protein n=1 Tax=Photobacterium swingsii TaxID=680026 RepID=UPI00352BE502